MPHRTQPQLPPFSVTDFVTTIICLIILLGLVVRAVALHYPLSFLLGRDITTNAPPSVITDFDAEVTTMSKAGQPVGSEIDPDNEIVFETMFREVASRYDLDWRLMAELAYQESRMDPLAVGRDNDMGLMQIIPTTWDEWAPQVGVTDPFDPYSNALVAAAYLAYIRDYSRANGYWEEHWVLVGYNWGPNNLRLIFEEQGDFSDVPEKQRRYVLAILEARSQELSRWQGE